MNGIHSGGFSHPPSGPQDGFCLLLSPGHPLALLLPGDERGFRASVIGSKPGEFLIVRPPSVLAARLGHDHDATVLVRLEEEGTIYGFEASVLALLKQPSPVMFISYPKHFEVRVLRRHPRFKCLIPTVVEGRDSVFPANLCDISLGGCKVVAPLHDSPIRATLEYGDLIDISLPVNGLRLEKLSGQIRLIKQDNAALNLGLAFREDQHTREVVSRFLDSLQKVETLRDEIHREAAKEAQAVHAPMIDMRDLEARVGEGNQIALKAQETIELQFTGSHLYDHSSILGVDGTETVIAEMPISTGVKSLPKPGMGLRARFEDHGSHYGFRTFVTKFITKPRPMVFFAYPKKIEILMRRRHPRVSCQLPVQLENDEFKAAGFISDISMGGCQVMANIDSGEMVCNVMTGDKLNLSLPMAGLRVGKLRAQVKSIHYQGTAVTLGLIFSLDKKLAGKLGELIGQLESSSH